MLFVRDAAIMTVMHIDYYYSQKVDLEFSNDPDSREGFAQFFLLFEPAT